MAQRNEGTDAWPSSSTLPPLRSRARMRLTRLTLHPVIFCSLAGVTESAPRMTSANCQTGY